MGFSAASARLARSCRRSRCWRKDGPAPTRRFGHKIVGASHATIPASAFGARFAEVRLDPDLAVLRIARIVSVTDGGRIVNEKLARSQLIGGIVGGIGMATFEETVTDPGT